MPEQLSGATTCFSCGQPHRGIYKVGCANDNCRVCAECLMRYGAEALRYEGDRLLAEFFAGHMRPKQYGGKCGHCGKWAPMLVFGLICEGCERKRRLLISTSGH